MEIKPLRKIKGVYWIIYDNKSKKLATQNLSPTISVYGEVLETINNVEYRVWDPYRSKLSAYIVKGARELPIKKNYKILYLGAGTGTTVSHISDLIGEKGKVFCVEFSARALRVLVDRVCKIRTNVYPFFADARVPEKYLNIIEQVDTVYCDVAQPNQGKILADNARIYLKEGGRALIAIKARSIDVSSDPEDIYQKELEVLKNRGFSIIDTRQLDPLEKDHLMVSCQLSTI